MTLEKGLNLEAAREGGRPKRGVPHKKKTRKKKTRKTRKRENKITKKNRI